MVLRYVNNLVCHNEPYHDKACFRPCATIVSSHGPAQSDECLYCLLEAFKDHKFFTREILMDPVITKTDAQAGLYHH